MNIVRSALQLFSSRVVKSLLGFFTVVIFSRTFGASPLGTYYPFLALIGIISIPSSLGINGAVEKRISEGVDKSQYLSTALLMKIPIILIISVVIYTGRDLVNQYLGANLTILLIIVLILDQIGGLSLPVLRGELRVGETASVEIVRPLCWLIFGYLFYTRGFGVTGIIYGYLIGTFLILIIGWWKVSIRLGRPTYKHARSLLDFGKYAMILHLGGSIFSWLDVAILSLFVASGMEITRGDIGAYENAWRLSLITVVASRAISTTVFPQFSRWDAEDATAQIEQLIPRAALPSLIIVIPSFVGTVILGGDLLSILFGPKFIVAKFALMILSSGMIVQSIHGVVGQPLIAIDRPDLAAYATIISILVNIILNFVLIWQIGIVGAAAATAISFTVNTVLHVYYLRRFLTIKLPLQEIGWSVIASIVMGLVVYETRSIIKIGNIFELVAIISFGVIIYTILIVIYPPLTHDIQEIIRKLSS